MYMCMCLLYPCLLCYLSGTGVDKQLQRLLANEKSNFKALAEAVGKIGGVPPLMMSSDMVNTLPDEKVKPQMWFVTACTVLADFMW